MIKIGRVTVSLEQREVYVEDRLLQVGSRAFDILELLIRAEGQTVTKDEILRHVWPKSVVEENNIHVQLSAVRKIFGADSQVIRTISGRGYRLTIPVVTHEPVGSCATAPAEQTVAASLNGLPVCHAPLIGRDEAIADITRALKGAPIVTLLGPGGIGKTQLGIAVARSIAAAAGMDVCFITLASVDNAQSVVGTVAAALGVGRADGDIPLQSLVAAIRGRKLLVLLDNCEHVIESAATVCETLVQASADLRILATSREPLRTRDEKFYWVAPLETPEVHASAQEILACSSVRMFLAQMNALNTVVEHDRGSLEMVATICRRLDGVPLALELAAARAAVFGIRKLVSELDDRFQCLTGGRRTAPARQQSLEAALDWSYQLLSVTERVVLQRLGVFAVRFSLEAACAVAACGKLSRNEVTEAIVGLASKCFLMTTFDSKTKEYFLLETAREYALRKLYESDEADEVLARQATCLAPDYEQPYGRVFGVAALGVEPLIEAVAGR
ncbi:putative ATPase/DNA-binding winged helix-turn-helix (wHTH) protein [Paraburkholderia bannensis]|uniref:Putative ATPase/DNA-binding winged helix-turn-helix (WHTH) protein n=1 Tax=Paraburkholderia bannensis TaxID=765414 RepID=A0A7W9U5K2_9BURK|nr:MULTISPECIES: winged helix-turn-helix domain-containing protein [Paraburkholderia]MBB3261677.1 putative ATPase/DNA-binding winged helix-turn-helix (wHTH) protein [Paraburkholderia sp. WP4_3_2]MBB6106701.1 putative ATPase/DNA-binding winged helix-turn-helix (wHTH) protein [Paraburkholderia bannensis]